MVKFNHLLPTQQVINMKTILVAASLVFASLILNQPVKAASPNHDLIKQHSSDIFESLVDIRRDLHRHPEVSGQEKRTSKLVADYLTELGLDVKTNIGGYGVVGILNGHKKGRKIAWRADMDAMHNNDADSVSFKSETAGVRHICGHDIHTTVGLGIANTLAKHAKNIDGTVYFLFQPEEENFVGAKAMIDDGLLALIQPDEIYGLHVAPLETGVVATKENSFYAYQRIVKLVFEGQADTEGLTNAVNNAAQSLSRGKLNSKFLGALMSGNIDIDSTDTVYQDYLLISGKLSPKLAKDQTTFEFLLFETEKDRLENILPTLKSSVLESKYKDRLTSIGFTEEHPNVFNDAELTNKSMAIIQGLFGKEAMVNIAGQLPYFNDDFAYFQERVPGVYFFLGASNSEKGITAMPHTPDFVADEQSIDVGVRYFSSLLLERLNQH